jgi:Lrp/AsnC family leucine-responsive transcriptional regulator
MDDIDYRILRELQFNARITNKALADRVGLSTTPCWNRLRNLEANGTVEKYVTIYNQQIVGFSDTVIINVILERHDDDVLRKFERALAQLPEVVEAYLLTGDYDYFIKVAVAGTAGYERFLREKLYKMPGIRHSRTSFTLRRLKQTYSVELPPTRAEVDRQADERPSARRRN